MEIFWFCLTQVHLKKLLLTWGERERERDGRPYGRTDGQTDRQTDNDDNDDNTNNFFSGFFCCWSEGLECTSRRSPGSYAQR